MSQGASGAGKTTLLDVLAQRKTQGRIQGEILVNGRPLDRTFARLAGYVEQQVPLYHSHTLCDLPFGILRTRTWAIRL